jgi:hypothetical protein
LESVLCSIEFRHHVCVNLYSRYLLFSLEALNKFEGLVS